MQNTEKAIIITQVKSLRAKLSEPLTPEAIAAMDTHLKQIEELAMKPRANAASTPKVQRSPNHGFYTGG